MLVKLVEQMLPILATTHVRRRLHLSPDLGHGLSHRVLTHVCMFRSQGGRNACRALNSDRAKRCIRDR